MLAATIGVISPSGNEVGPFLSIEQACSVATRLRPSSAPDVFAWYNLVGSFATALGALIGGDAGRRLMQEAGGMSPLLSYRVS